MDQLPIIDCNNCGLCCTGVMSPPGFQLCFNGWPKDFAVDDQAIVATMPPELRDELISHYQKVVSIVGYRKGEPCIWYDPASKKCRNYEYRPTICREFEVGGEGCLKWREDYAAELP